MKLNLHFRPEVGWNVRENVRESKRKRVFVWQLRVAIKDGEMQQTMRVIEMILNCRARNQASLFRPHQ
jgi:hypothetical protein